MQESVGLIYLENICQYLRLRALTFVNQVVCALNPVVQAQHSLSFCSCEHV